ncbi:TPA: MucBP domain-containing protein, partial [Listeria monocytogenes]|nr:MucBP domain-containing protein [Listeria monocytogenes]
KIIDGYTLKETPGNATGQFSETLQNVTYIYEKTAVQNGTVTVKYQDESGKTLAKDTVLTGEVNNTYQTKSKDIAGYKLQKVEGNESGTFSTTPATVTYIYEKIANSDNTNTNGEMTDNTTLSTNDTVISSEATKKVDKNTSNILPTTGDSKDALFFALGSLLTLLSTSFFFFKRS